MRHNLQHCVYTNRNETINICTNTQETKSTKLHSIQSYMPNESHDQITTYDHTSKNNSQD